MFNSHWSQGRQSYIFYFTLGAYSNNVENLQYDIKSVYRFQK
jgi:hypothetical protein